jgi:hypothetical protein
MEKMEKQAYDLEIKRLDYSVRIIMFLMFYSVYGWILPGILGHPGVT